MQLQLQNIEKGISQYYPPETNVSVPWCKVYRKEFLENHQLAFIPNIIRMPDAIFNMYAFEHAKKIYHLEEYIYHYQKNSFSICQRYSKDTIAYYETYFEFVKSYIQTFKKDKRFEDILNIKMVTSIDIYMTNDFFHKQNPKTKKEIKTEFLTFLRKPLYVNAIKEVKTKYLSTYQKLVFLLAKYQQYGLLKFVHNLKKKIKDILK